MLELTKLKKQLAEKRAQLAFHVRTGDEDRATWCKEDIVLLTKREANLEAARKAELRANRARYARTAYAKRRAEYMAGPCFQADNLAAWERRLARRKERLARKAERAIQVEQRKARIAAMSPEERSAFYKAERSKNSDFHAQHSQSKKWLEEQRAKAARERRARHAETRKRNAEERKRLWEEFLAKKEAESAGPTLNANPSDSPGLLTMSSNEPAEMH